MQIIKTIIVFIILHRWNKIDKEGIELMLRWYDLRKRNWITRKVFFAVLNLNGFKKTEAGWQNY